MTTHQPKQHFPHSSQAGFTIIESLIALLVVTILLVGIAPAITLSVAARIQARRVERASEAAKTYIDGVRAGAIPAPEPDPTATTPLTLANVPAPTARTLNCPQGGAYCPPAPPPHTLYCVDLDKAAGCTIDSPNDVIVQAVRTVGDADKGYVLGIRVYRANAFGAGGNLLSSLGDQRQTQAAFSGTLGNPKAPVVEMTADVAPVLRQNTLSTWCDRLKDLSNTASDCR